MLIGLIAGWLLQHRKIVKIAAKLGETERDRDRLGVQLQEEEKQFKDRKEQMETDFEARRNDREKSFQRQLDDQQMRFDETIRRVQEEMKTTTNNMLKERQREFAETSHTNIGQIVDPLRETIDKMKKAMEESTSQQTRMSGAMEENLKQMMEQSQKAQKSTEELTRVFKFGNKVQGNWGEAVLNELLHSQGLTEGIHYDLQSSMHDEQGNRAQPDVILHLDKQRELIIDAKVSLSDFMDYVNAETEEQRQKHLDAHVNSLKKHVKELAAKDYSSYIKPPKTRMDYVIMFVPNTGALWTALNRQPDLWRKAMEQNVFIADEQTLFAALRIIDMTWRQIQQTEQHEQVYKLATEMLDRVGQFWEKYETIGNALDKARNAYEDGKKKLDPKGQSILNTANKLTKLGAKQSKKKNIPGIEGF